MPHSVCTFLRVPILLLSRDTKSSTRPPRAPSCQRASCLKNAPWNMSLHSSLVTSKPLPFAGSMVLSETRRIYRAWFQLATERKTTRSSVSYLASPSTFELDLEENKSATKGASAEPKAKPQKKKLKKPKSQRLKKWQNPNRQTKSHPKGGSLPPKTTSPGMPADLLARKRLAQQLPIFCLTSTREKSAPFLKKGHP